MDNFDIETNEIVPIDRLSSAIKNGGISVDDEAVQGAYNFTFNERRMKAEVQLLSGEGSLNETLTQALFESERLPDLTKDGNHESYPAFIFNDKRAMQVWDSRRFWGGASETEAAGCTYSPGNLGSGTLIPHSWHLVQAIYGALVSLTHVTGNSEHELADFSGNVKKYRIHQSVTGSYFHKQPEYKLKFRAGGQSYAFLNSFYNIVNFIMRGMEIDNNTEILSPSSFSKFEQFGVFFKGYLDSILVGLGSNFESFVIINDIWNSPEVRSVYPVNGFVSSLSNDITSLFFGAKFYKTNIGVSSATNHVCYLGFAWRAFDMYLCSVSEASQAVGGSHMKFANEAGGQSCYYHLLSSSWTLRLATFIASILKYSWHESELARFALNGYSRTALKINSAYTNCCLFHQNRHVIRGTHGFNFTSEFEAGQWANHMSMVRSDYNYGATLGESKLLKCLKNIEFEGTPDDNVYFGKVQVRTEESDERMVFEPHPTDPYPEDSLFQPVMREYRVGSGVYKLFSDNLDIATLSVNRLNDFALAACMFEGTNWIYFDDVQVIERGCNYRTPSEVYFDPIPIFDMDNEASYDGTYVYADNFTKFFTSLPAKLTNIVATLMDDERLIYRGLVDATSVQQGRKSVSFTASDPIGLLAENISALDGCIAWAQYSRDLSSHVALPYCGTTIHAFMRFLLRGGVFGMLDTADLPSFPKNKLLKDISTNDAFVIGVQCLRKLVVSDYQSFSIKFLDIDSSMTPIEIPQDRIINKTLSSVDNRRERFNPELLKNLSGFENLMTDLSKFYNGLFTNKNLALELECLSDGLNIKVLDKISIGSIICIVMSISRNLRRKTININGVRVQ